MGAFISALIFIYTLFMIFLCVFASSASFCSFLVTHRRLFLARTCLFVSFICERSFLFFREFSGGPSVDPAVMGRPWFVVFAMLFTFSAATAASSVWCVMEHLGSPRQRQIAVPVACMVAAQLLAIPVGIHSTTYRWLMYAFREIAVLATIGYWFATLVSSKEGSQKSYLQTRRGIVIAIALLVLGAFAEDTAAFLLSDMIDAAGPSSPLELLASDNILESAAIVVYAIHTIRESTATLSLRFKEPPNPDDVIPTEVRDATLSRFAEHRGLTPSERKVLELSLKGQGTQEIANTLVVSVGTVKTHFSHIYRKVGVANRTELLRAFWQEL